MVLNITVKTLDSQNYQFEADDDWTVCKFKEHIQETVDVTANEQRLIFCGRVLQNDKKLTEYDCNGKVIHLVRRPPPSLDNPNPSSSAADSNNNDNGFSGEADENGRFADDNNVLFSAMTLGPDGNVNHILRHIMTLQQAFYSRTLGDPILTDAPVEPALEMDRRLNNAARLLRITVNLITECMARLPTSSPSATRLVEAQSSLVPQRSLITSASSHTDLQRENGDTTQRVRSSSAMPETTMDDSRVGQQTNANVPSRRLSRQSLTTDDLPQSASRPLAAPLMSINIMRSRNENRTGTRLTGSERDDFYLGRYLNTLNCANDVQNQVQGLVRRYRELVNISRRGGLILPQSSSSSDPARANSQDSQSNSTTSSTPVTEGQSSSQTQSGQISNALTNEARILSQYVPRIMHHSSHLQHALSEFSVDMIRGRLYIVNNISNRLQATARPPPPTHQPRSDQSNRFRDASPADQTLEGSLTITATTVETNPIISSTSTSNLRPQASATIVLTSEPGQAGIHIPVSIPLITNQLNMDFPLAHNHTTFRQTGNQQGQQQQQPAQQDQQPQSQQQQRASQPGTTSNSTQTAPRPIGVISGRIPLPFDYYLNCFSPYANYSVATRSPPRSGPLPSARIQLRTSRQQGATNPNAQAYTHSERNPPNAPVADPGLTEVVSNIMGSIFRSPNQREQASQQTTTQGTNQSQDPLLNIIPELAINAASQVLGGLFGSLSNTINQRPSVQQSHQNQRQASSSGPTMMDIDIDDNSSSQSESRYQDARESSSPSATSSTVQPLGGPSSSRQATNYRPEPSRASSSSRRYNHNQLVEVMQNHPDWIPIIEADINIMDQHNNSASGGPPYFSDAYLSSIPRKRRRLLTATPDRVLILQPSPSQAITNLLRRAILSSSSSNVESLDPVLNSIANDSDLQAAYEDYIKSAVEARLRSDYDYCPEKFENSSKYFK